MGVAHPQDCDACAHWVTSLHTKRSNQPALADLRRYQWGVLSAAIRVRAGLLGDGPTA